MNKQDLKSKIEKLEKGIASKVTPENLKASLKSQKEKFEKELVDLEKKEKSDFSKKIKDLKASVKTKSTKSSLSRDGARKAKKAGKKISEDGNVYYEKRANRTDSQTDKKPYLEKGGELKKHNITTDNKTYADDLLKYADLQGIKATTKKTGKNYKITFDSKLEEKESMTSKLKELVKKMSKGGESEPFSKTGKGEFVSTEDRLNSCSQELFNKKYADCSREERDETFDLFLKKYAISHSSSRKMSKGGLIKIEMSDIEGSDFQSLSQIFESNDAAFSIDESEEYVLMDLKGLPDGDEKDEALEIIGKYDVQKMADGGKLDKDISDKIDQDLKFIVTKKEKYEKELKELKDSKSQDKDTITYLEYELESLDKLYDKLSKIKNQSMAKGGDLYDDMDEDIVFANKKTKMVANSLKGLGYNVLKVEDADYDTDAEITLSKKVGIQIGLEGNFAITIEKVTGQFTFIDCGKSYATLLEKLATIDKKYMEKDNKTPRTVKLTLSSKDSYDYTYKQDGTTGTAGQITFGFGKEPFQYEVKKISKSLEPLKQDILDAFTIQGIKQHEYKGGFSEAIKHLDTKVVYEDKMAKGGNVKYYDKDNEYKIGRPSGYIEKEILEKVSHNEDEFVGSFGWKTSMGKMAEGYLYNLNDFDENLVKDIKLKQGEKIFRYLNRTTSIGGMRPFIKINIDKELIYFLVNLDDDGIEFETKGVQANYIALIEDKMAGGGFTSSFSGTPDRRRVTMAEGGYVVVEGFDHYKNKPLYQVISKDENSDYVGEWHDSKEDAENELQSLSNDYMAAGGKIFKREKFVPTPIKEGDTFLDRPQAKSGYYNYRIVRKIDGKSTEIQVVDTFNNNNYSKGNPYTVPTSYVQNIVDEIAKEKFDEQQDIKEGAFNLSKEIGADKAVFRSGDLKIPKVRAQLYATLKNLASVQKNVSDSSVGAAPNSMTFRASQSGTAISVNTNNVHRGGYYDSDIMYILQVQVGGAISYKNKKIIMIVLENLLSKYTFTTELGTSKVRTSDGTNWSSVMLTAPSSGKSYIPLKELDSFRSIRSMEHGGYMADGGNVSKIEKIKDYYVNKFPTDDLGTDINSEATFDGLYKALDNQDVYEYIGVNDSLVRERVFQKLSEIMGVKYDEIYSKWLDSDYADGGMMADGGEVNKHNYMMLDRLRSDNDYYLGNGNRYEKHLWAGNVDAQIAEMKKLWNQLPKDKKPDWLSMEDIENYEKEMKSNKMADGGSVGQNMYVFGYTTQNFDLCPLAVEEFVKAVDVIGQTDSDAKKTALSRAAMYVDDVLGVEKKAKEDNIVSKNEFLYAVNQSIVASAYNYASGLEVNLNKFLPMHIFEIAAKLVHTDQEARKDELTAYDLLVAKNKIGEAAFKNMTPEERRNLAHEMKHSFEDGGSIEDSNYRMVVSQAKAIKHHADELLNVLTPDTSVEAWVVGKIERASTDLSDITHYIDGLSGESEETEVVSDTYFAEGGQLEKGVYYLGKPKKEGEVWGQKIVELDENGLSFATDYARKLKDFPSKDYKKISEEELSEFIKNSPKHKNVSSDISKFEHYANGGMIAGRWYRDNQGVEYRYIGEDSTGQSLFSDGQKVSGKSLDDFESDTKEKKSFSWFKEGGYMAQGGELNLGIRKMAQEEGFTPKELGKEYELTMAQAVVEALTDANYHDAARKLVSLLEKNPKMAIKPNYPNPSDPKFNEKFEAINKEYDSKYWEADDKTRNFAIKVSQKSGWDGYAIAGAFEYLVRVDGGYHKLADNIEKAMESSDSMAKGGVIKVGDYIRIKDGMKGKLMNIEGENLEVKKITKQRFPSGMRKFYHVEYDGYTYDVRADLVDYDKMAEGGMTEHGLRIGDKVTTDMFWDNQIVVENQKTHKRAQINLETGQRKDEMADGGELGNSAAKQAFNKGVIDVMADDFVKKLKTKGISATKRVSKNGVFIYGEKRENGKYKYETYISYSELPNNEFLEFEESEFLRLHKKMAMGGKVTFDDKVKAIKASLLKKKKVSPKVQKDYGKTYSPKEAEQSAKRIVGSMTKKGMK